MARLSAAGFLATLALAVVPAPASADAYPCGDTFGGDPAYSRQYCPDWSPNNWIPVYSTPYETSQIIDWIYAPGADWYYYQCRRGVHHLGRYWNSWWAATKGDNYGRTGWVPETFFRGGVNNERDARLVVGVWC
jgi:hypothetical protein